MLTYFKHKIVIYVTKCVNIFYYIKFVSMSKNILTDYVNMEQMKNAIMAEVAK